MVMAHESAETRAGVQVASRVGKGERPLPRGGQVEPNPPKLVAGPSLHAARRQVAQALGATARRLWRRPDLTSEDEMVCDLTAEALARVSRLLRGPPRANAQALLSFAPVGIQREVEMLAAIARRDNVAASEPTKGAPVFQVSLADALGLDDAKSSAGTANLEAKHFEAVDRCLAAL